MAETEPNKTRKKRTKKPRTGTVTTLQVTNIPWDLFDRISGKAGFVGLGRDEWIREVMERETAEGISLQQKWKQEHEANKLRPAETEATKEEKPERRRT